MFQTVSIMLNTIFLTFFVYKFSKDLLFEEKNKLDFFKNLRFYQAWSLTTREFAKPIL